MRSELDGRILDKFGKAGKLSKDYLRCFLENRRLTSGQNSFRTFDAISTPICMPSFLAASLTFRLSG